MRSKRGFQLFHSPDHATLPPGTRVYAVGDIHGCLDLLERLVARIERDAAKSTAQLHLVFLGDYVDRGSDTKGVVDFLLRIPDRFSTRFIRGNHDQSLLDFLDSPATYREWRDFGATETLRSYGVPPPVSPDLPDLIQARDQLARAIPNEHMRFFTSLLASFEIGDYLFVHAGLRPQVDIAKQTLRDMMWIRDDFLLSTEDFGKIIVHGHSPQADPVHRDNRIGVDTGAYLTGRLTAAVLEGTSVRFVRS